MVGLWEWAFKTGTRTVFGGLCGCGQEPSRAYADDGQDSIPCR